MALCTLFIVGCNEIETRTITRNDNVCAVETVEKRADFTLKCLEMQTQKVMKSQRIGFEFVKEWQKTFFAQLLRLKLNSGRMVMVMVGKMEK